MKNFATSPSMETDRFINSAVRNHLRVNRDKVDLSAMTIQRGRDHKISGYIEYENFCSKDIRRRMREKSPSKIFPNMKTPRINKINNFFDLGQKWNFDWKSAIWKFQETYKQVQDIDLFSGGMSEPPIKAKFCFTIVTILHIGHCIKKTIIVVKQKCHLFIKRGE